MSQKSFWVRIGQQNSVSINTVTSEHDYRLHTHFGSSCELAAAEASEMISSLCSVSLMKREAKPFISSTIPAWKVRVHCMYDGKGKWKGCTRHNVYLIWELPPWQPMGTSLLIEKLDKVSSGASSLILYIQQPSLKTSEDAVATTYTLSLLIGLWEELNGWKSRDIIPGYHNNHRRVVYSSCHGDCSLGRHVSVSISIQLGNNNLNNNNGSLNHAHIMLASMTTPFQTQGSYVFIASECCGHFLVRWNQCLTVTTPWMRYKHIEGDRNY